MKITRFLFLTFLLIFSFALVRETSALRVSKPVPTELGRASIGDIDNDGDLDMYITTNGGPNKLWTNNGAGVFTTSVIAANDTGNSVGSVMGDLNGDGFLDIHVVRWGNVNNVIWMSNGTGGFTRQLISGDLNEFPYYNLMGDVNGDGFLDIYVITDASSIPARQNNLRINNGSGGFTKSNITGDAFKSRGGSMGDVDGDGDLDIHVAQTPNAQNFLRINNGSGIFTSNNIPGDILSSYGSQMGDLDGDGDLDIYVTNLSQQRKIWLNNGLGSFTVRDTTGDNVGTTIYSSLGDIDGDGDLDIHATAGGGQNKLWINDGAAYFTPGFITGDSGSTLVSFIRDFDGDGKNDLFTANSSLISKLRVYQESISISILAPTILSNASITDTTITIMSSGAVFATGVSINTTGTTATTSSFNCLQISPNQVDCTISIDSSGKIVIDVVGEKGGVESKTQAGYIVDLISPTIPSVAIDALSPFSANDPQIGISTTDNLAVSGCQIYYVPDNNGPGTGSSTFIDVTNHSLTVLDLDPDFTVHEVLVRCYDTAGNYSDNIVKFPPIITFITPTPVSGTTITNAQFSVYSPLDNPITNIVLSGSNGSPSLGSCVGSGGDLTDPYNSPVVCNIDNINASATISIVAEDSVNSAEGTNSRSYIIDSVPQNLTIYSPLLVSSGSITTTTIEVEDASYGIYSTGITVDPSTTAMYTGFVCTQISFTQVSCDITILDDGNLVIRSQDIAGNVVSVTRNGYIIDTILPSLTIVDDVSLAPSTGDLVLINASDDMILMTGSALYGFSTGSSCAIPDAEYQFPFVPGSGLLFNTEDNNGEYLCFKIQDHVGNTVYAASVNPLNIDVSGPTVPVITNVDGDLFNPFYTNDANTSILITSESGSTLTLSDWTCTPTPVNGSGQVSCIPNVSLTEGTIFVTPVACDLVNNCVSGSMSSITLDTIPPVIGGAVSVGGDVTAPYLTNDTTPAVILTGENGSTMSITGWTCTPNPIAGGQTTCTPDVALVDGVTSITPVLCDLASNCTTGGLISMTIDTIAPLMGVVSVGGDVTAPYLTNDTTPAVILTGENGSTMSITGWTCTPNPIAGGQTTCTPDVALVDGVTSITPVLCDLANNCTTGASISMTIDTIAPLMGVVSVGGDVTAPYLTNDTTPAVVLTGENGSTMSITGWTCAPNPIAGGQTTCTPDVALVDGVTSITPVLCDLASNCTTGGLISMTIDTIAPLMGVVSVGGDVTAPYLTNDTTPAVVLTGENGSTMSITGWTCTPNPIAGGQTTCTPDVALVDGVTSITPVLCDLANNCTTGASISMTIDTVLPIVVLQGSGDMTIAHGSIYVEDGANWTDNVDGTATNINISGSVDTNTIGVYVLEYTYIDFAGNISIIVTRTVRVTDQTPPVITLNGGSTMTVVSGTPFIDPGALWNDNVDGTGVVIAISGTVNTGTVGTYFITYSYTDQAGNVSSSVTRTVNVIPATVAGGGGGSNPTKDNCPNGDYSPSYYDGLCGTKPVISTGIVATGTIITTGLVTTGGVETGVLPVITPEVFEGNTSTGNACPYVDYKMESFLGLTTESQKRRFIVCWLYTNKQTMFDQVVPFDYDRIATREEASRMIGNFVKQVLKKEPIRKRSDKICQFTDLSRARSGLVPYIKQSCIYGVFNGTYDNEFLPNEWLNQAHAIATVLRSSYGYQDEKGSDPWFLPYANLIQEKDLERRGFTVPETDLMDLYYKGMTRGNLGEFMYRVAVDIFANK